MYICVYVYIYTYDSIYEVKISKWIILVFFDSNYKPEVQNSTHWPFNNKVHSNCFIELIWVKVQKLQPQAPQAVMCRVVVNHPVKTGHTRLCFCANARSPLLAPEQEAQL